MRLTHRQFVVGALLALPAFLAPNASAFPDEKQPTKIEFKGWFSNPVFTADGKTLIYGQMSEVPAGERTTRTQIVVWDVTGRKETRRIDGPADDSLIGSIAVSPDGKRLALCLWNTALRIWDLDKGKELGKPAGSQGAQHISFGPDTGSVGWVRDGDIRVTDAANVKELQRIAKDADGPAMSLALVGKDVIAGYLKSEQMGPGKNPVMEHQISYWVRDGENGKKLRQVGETVKDQRKRMEGLSPHAMFLSADKKTIALAGDRGAIQLCDAASGKKTKEIAVPWKAQGDDPIRKLAFSGDLKVAAITTAKGAITVWDVAAGKELHRFETGQSLDHVTLSPDAKTLAVTHQTPGRVGAVLLIYDLEVRK